MPRRLSARKEPVRRRTGCRSAKTVIRKLAAIDTPYAADISYGGSELNSPSAQLPRRATAFLEHKAWQLKRETATLALRGRRDRREDSGCYDAEDVSRPASPSALMRGVERTAVLKTL